MKRYLFLIAILLVTVAFGQDKQRRIGGIEFFGYTNLNLDLDKIRTAMPLREGDELSPALKQQAIDRFRESVKQTTGHEPTDVLILCCDERGQLTFYLGLPGKSVANVPYNPTPKGSVRFPPDVVSLYKQMSDAWMNAMQRGVFGEDDSKGYALSVDPAARAKQLAVREYAVDHEPFVRRVLESSRDTEQRQIAADILGYARQSRQQIAALVRASRDADESVRNNAVRALGVLARSSPQVAGRIPAEGFIAMLNSGSWTDRNKSAGLLAALSERRDPQLLNRLRSQALQSLIEMARWRSSGHASDARMMLGRVAGVEEARLQQLVHTGQVDQIINALQRTR